MSGYTGTNLRGKKEINFNDIPFSVNEMKVLDCQFVEKYYKEKPKQRKRNKEKPKQRKKERKYYVSFPSMKPTQNIQFA